MRWRAIVMTGLAAAGLALAACSTGPGAVHTGTAAAAKPMTAAQVVAALKARGLPVTLAKAYTSATDPNHLLGRPGEYTSKADFTDSRVSGAEVAGGGSVEVFASNSGAVRRASYIQAVTQAAPFLGAEYDYAGGGVLLRVSGKLTPAQARAYQAALKAITGVAVTQPSPAST